MNSIARKITIFAKIYLMKSFLLILLFFSVSLLTAQERQQTKQGNVFNSTDDSDTSPGTTSDSGNNLEGDDVADPAAPIDDYLPLLVLTAVGIIIYQTHKKRNLLS